MCVACVLHMHFLFSFVEQSWDSMFHGTHVATHSTQAVEHSVGSTHIAHNAYYTTHTHSIHTTALTRTTPLIYTARI